MQCEESRNHNPLLNHIGHNTNCRNIVDEGLKFNLFLNWENRIAHKLFWNSTSHKLSSLKRAFHLFQYPVPGNVYCQMLQNMWVSIFSTKMTCFVVMLASKTFSNFSNTFKTCQTSFSSNASKTIPLGRTMLPVLKWLSSIPATSFFGQCLALVCPVDWDATS